MEICEEMVDLGFDFGKGNVVTWYVPANLSYWWSWRELALERLEFVLVLGI